MTQTNINELRDTTLVEAAASALAAAQSRLDAAARGLQAAAAGVDSAFADARDRVLSAAAGSNFDALAGADAYRAATARAEFAAKVLDACENQVAEAMQKHSTAEGESWRPVHDRGREIRLEAIRAADAARVELAKAERLFAEGSRLIQLSHANKLPRQFDGALLSLKLRNHMPPRPEVPSEAEEIDLWETPR